MLRLLSVPKPPYFVLSFIRVTCSLALICRCPALPAIMVLRIIKIVMPFILAVISFDVSSALSPVSPMIKTKTHYLQMKITSNADGNANNNNKTKHIAIVGAGAVGSYYGGRIWESVRTQCDTNVMFHLRGEHYDHCTKNGIDVSSYHGDFSIPPEELLAFRSTEDMAKSVDGGTFDWVICSLKSTSVSADMYVWVIVCSECLGLQPFLMLPLQLWGNMCLHNFSWINFQP